MKTAAFSAAELRFGGWIPRVPDLSDFYAKGRGGLQPGASRDSIPPWGRPKADHAAGSFARRSAKADCAARTSSRRSAKADCAARTSPRRSAKADRAARTSSRRSAKADCTTRTSSRRSGKTTTPPGLLRGEARKPTTAVAFARTGLFRPRGRPERRASL